MRARAFLEIVSTILFVALFVFLALVLFIKPAFMNPITAMIHNFGVFSIGGAHFSLGGTFALVLFFGLMVPVAHGLKK